MTITRWDPLRELAALQHQVNGLFQDYNRGKQGQDEFLTGGSFVPPVDIYENEHDFVLKLEVPGIEQKDVNITLENNTLTVRGERRLEREEKEENFRRVERQYGSFVRSFALPNTIDTENVQAGYENGILKIELSKRAEAKPKQIKVNIGAQPTLEGKKSTTTAA